MEPLDKFKLLMGEIGDVIKATSVTQFEDKHWALEFGEEKLIWLSYHQEDDCFTLSIDVGAVQEKDKLEFLEFLLIFNALGQTQRTLKTALDGEGNNCLLLGDYTASGLALLNFAEIIVAFAEQSIHWSYLLKNWPGASSEDKQKLLENISLMDHNLIRA
ncbi:type III secretion system chaperone [Thalassomonas viridans]|uniref:Type III secretion system chaperone n=1 Tax=Thalassomonas viridans TaxID=137584 RepID=A0AAE9YYA6_9GAMM|nr:type III secretion system chaperone [Thalassomonas viridans]WDE02782.1 type III secretion system chaperone [Thalassomonas viridans]